MGGVTRFSLLWQAGSDAHFEMFATCGMSSGRFQELSAVATVRRISPGFWGCGVTLPLGNKQMRRLRKRGD